MNSARETAEELAFAWEARQTSGSLKACDYEALIEHIKHTILSEREACARLMETYANGNHDDRNRAAAIRARQ
jgi:hypothetical protein